MKDTNTFLKLLLPQGRNTDPQRLENAYTKLAGLPNGSDETRKLLAKAYMEAKEILNSPEEEIKQTVDMDLVKGITPSITFKQVGRFKRVKNMIKNGPSVVNLGEIRFKRPGQMGDYIHMYGIQYKQGEEFVRGMTDIDIYRMCEDEEYREAVVNLLLDKDHVAEAEKKANYLGRLEKENGKWKIVEDPEELAACIGFKENEAMITIRGMEKYR